MPLFRQKKGKIIAYFVNLATKFWNVVEYLFAKKTDPLRASAARPTFIATGCDVQMPFAETVIFFTEEHVPLTTEETPLYKPFAAPFTFDTIVEGAAFDAASAASFVSFAAGANNELEIFMI